MEENKVLTIEKIVKTLPGIIEALSANAMFIFKGIEEVATPECKAALYKNIEVVRLKINEIEKLLEEKV